MLLTLLGSAAPVTNTALDAIKAGNPTFWNGKTIALVGDSTTDDVGAVGGYMGPRLSAYTGAGLQLAGATILDDGWTGSTLRDWLDDNVAYGITHTLAANPYCIVLCHNINGVRTGADDAADMQAQLEEAVAAIHAGRPSCIIILWTPNSFLTVGSDVTGTTPQAATDALWNGYNNVVNQWPTYVAHLDKQTNTYGRTCQASSSLMQDQIHPSDAGYDLDEAQIVAALTPDDYPFLSADPFIDDVVLILNGDGLTDATGRHTVTNTGSGGDAVTASSGWLNFPTVDAGLAIGALLGDFDFGTNATAVVTVDIEIQCAPQTGRTNGQRLVAIDSGMELTLTADPDVNFQSGAPFGGNAGGPLDDGNVHALTYQFSGDQFTAWVDGAVIDNKYDSVDLTPTALALLYIGRAVDGWNALGYVGKFRGRWTKAARYTHNASITPPTWPVPTGASAAAYDLIVSPASYNLALAPVSMVVGRALPVSPAAYAVTAAPVTLQVARALPVSPAAYALSLAPVTFEYVPAAGGDYVLSVDPVAYTLTRPDVAMIYSGGAAPGGGSGAGFEMGPRREIQTRHFKPLLQRVLEARYPRVKPAKERAAKRAKAIEVEAAQLIADDGLAQARFDELMRQWAGEGIAVPSGIDLRSLFEAQVGFRLRQMALDNLARQALAAQRARDEEDSLMALLLA